MYNIFMADRDMLDTRYLFQPRGPGTAFLFRMATPEALVGQINPRTDKPYGREIREGLGGVRTLTEALKLRDLRLGAIRVEEMRARGGQDGSTEQALEIAASLREIEDPEERDAVESVLIDAAERIEKRQGTEKAVRWYKAATGQRTPFGTACDQYKADRGKALGKTTLNNLNTAAKEFKEFAGEDVCLEEVDRRLVARFVTEFLPNKKGPKAPEGQGPATIRKKVSMLSQVWSWAAQRGILPYSKETPWDEQAPSKKDIKARAKVRRMFEPEETTRLLATLQAGSSLGDTFRVALMTGVRLEEVASLDAAHVDPEARYYVVTKGKTENAVRTVPLAGLAREVIKARLKKVDSKGPLFPELPVRKSTGKRGGSLSQEFTRVRREELGDETDGELALHALRHTWATAARRVGVDERTWRELGGWTRGNGADVGYDHGLELKRYQRDQEKVARWLKDKGYLG
jgi:integrase